MEHYVPIFLLLSETKFWEWLIPEKTLIVRLKLDGILGFRMEIGADFRYTWS